MRLATAAQMGRMDAMAIGERGITSLDLMERAAEGLAAAGREALAARPGTVAVFCGTGNNGGDGLAAARLLEGGSTVVRVFLTGKRERMTADSAEMARRLEACGIKGEPWKAEAEQLAYVAGCALVIDALFGVGLNRPITDELTCRAIEAINDSGAFVLAADIASGVDADSGRVLGTAVRADKTITFTVPKIGQFIGEGAVRSGRVSVWPIGLPEDILNGETFPVRSLEMAEIRTLLPPRRADGHKGSFGKLLILAGSAAYTGAPLLAARAAVRGGCGLVTLGVPAGIWQLTASRCLEEMPLSLLEAEGGLAYAALEEIERKLADCQALLLGPGLGRGRETGRLVRSLVERWQGPLVLDADGINALEGHMDSLERRRGRVTVLTPHDGEFARLGGDLSGGERLDAARGFAERYGCVLVLKGHRTLVASPGGFVAVNTTGNSGMAKGGSGDVLAGLLASLLAQGLEPKAAATAAVWLHGRAGDLAAAELTEYAMTPGDLIGRLPQTFREVIS